MNLRKILPKALHFSVIPDVHFNYFYAHCYSLNHCPPLKARTKCSTEPPVTL